MKKKPTKTERAQLELGVLLFGVVVMLAITNLHTRISLMVLLAATLVYIVANKAHYISSRQRVSFVYISELVLVGVLVMVASVSNL